MTTSSLLGWRLRLALASLRGKGGRRRAVQLLVTSWVAAMFMLGSSLGFREMARDSSLAPLASVAVFGVLHAAFLLSLFRDTGAAIGHLFLAPDVPLLLSMPIRVRPLLLLRALEAVADAFSFPATLLVPILWGYGIAVAAPWTYYAAVPAVMVCLLCITVGLGFLVSLAIAPVVPVGRVRSWIRGVSAAIYLFIWMGLAWWNVTGARHPESLPAGLGPDTASWAAHGPIAWTPSAWAARLLLQLAGRQSILVPLLVLSGTILIVASLLAWAAPRYPVSWQKAQELARKLIERRSRRRSAPATMPAGEHSSPGAVPSGDLGSGLSLGVAFFHRDRRLIARDTGLLWDIGLLVFMSSVLPLLAAPALARHVSWIVLPALLFFATELGFDLASRALPLERRALPWVLRAPISPGALCVARMAGTWMLGAPLVAGLAVLATLAVGGGGGRAALALGGGLVVFTALVPIGFAAGAFFGQPDWRHPRQMLNLGGRMVLAGLLVILCVGIAFAYAERGSRVDGGRLLLVWGIPAAAGILVLDGVALWAAALRLRRFQWLH
jgi:hypothetical protein